MAFYSNITDRYSLYVHDGETMRMLTQYVFIGQPDNIQSGSVNDRGHVWLHESWFYPMTYNNEIGAWLDANGDFGIPKGSDYDGSEPKCIARLSSNQQNRAMDRDVIN